MGKVERKEAAIGGNLLDWSFDIRLLGKISLESFVFIKILYALYIKHSFRGKFSKMEDKVIGSRVLAPEQNLFSAG